MRPPHVPSELTGTRLPSTLPMRGCWTSPAEITCVEPIHPHPCMASVRVPPLSKVVPDAPTIAVTMPSGDRYAGVKPWMENDRTVVPVQLMTFALACVSHTLPAGEGGPAIQQVPPMVNLRTAVAGSTTWNSCGPQQPGPPPWVQAGTLATTRLLVPCQPVGQRVNGPDSLNVLT